jgi:hypothetical protein
MTGLSQDGIAMRRAVDRGIQGIVAPDAAPVAAPADCRSPCFRDIGTTMTTGAPPEALHGAHDQSNDPVQRAEQLRDAGSEVVSKVDAITGHSPGTSRAGAFLAPPPICVGA